MGAESFLYSAMEEKFARGDGGWLVKECGVREFGRAEVKDEEAQERLWKYSEKMVEEAEKRGAVERAKVKKEDKERKEEADAVKEMEDYKTKVGKKDGKKVDGSRRSKKI